MSNGKAQERSMANKIGGRFDALQPQGSDASANEDREQDFAMLIGHSDEFKVMKTKIDSLTQEVKGAKDDINAQGQKIDQLTTKQDRKLDLSSKISEKMVNLSSVQEAAASAARNQAAWAVSNSAGGASHGFPGGPLYGGNGGFGAPAGGTLGTGGASLGSGKEQLNISYEKFPPEWRKALYFAATTKVNEEVHRSLCEFLRIDPEHESLDFSDIAMQTEWDLKEYWDVLRSVMTPSSWRRKMEVKFLGIPVEIRNIATNVDETFVVTLMSFIAKAFHAGEVSSASARSDDALIETSLNELLPATTYGI